MGLLRFLLAVSVIISHSRPYHGISFIGGPLAVETFFMISGFYIAMILNEKYIGGKGSYWLFISNRFLRLYPMYWVVLICSLIIALIIPDYNKTAVIGHVGNYQEFGEKLSLSSWVFLIFTHIAIFFQDVALFMGLSLDTGNLYLTHTFHNTGVKVFQFMLIAQAWSIALELMFYAIAPFIVRNKRLIVILTIVSFTLKYWGSHHGYGDDPWSYRFFPFELGYFLLGSTGYFIYKRYISKAAISNWIYISNLCIVIFLTIFLKKLNIPYGDFLYLGLIFVSIPLQFNFTKSSKKDRLIGELSYPIYLIHVTVINVIAALQVQFHPDLLVIGGSVVVSFILVKYISNPIESIRHKRVPIPVLSAAQSKLS